MTRIIENVACTLCGCVCDDLRLTVDQGRIVRAEGACTIAEPWFLGQEAGASPAARIGREEAPLEEAIARAAAILRQARAPLIFGLSRSTTAGQRAALQLADYIGATIDTPGNHAATLALQQVGQSTCSLGEVRNRADLVIFWATNPIETHPRHWQRYSVLPNGRWVPQGRTNRTIVTVDSHETATSAEADIRILVEPGQDLEALCVLRGLMRDSKPEPGTVDGALLAQLEDLLDRMKKCRFGVIFFGPGMGQGDLGHHAVAALFALVADLNAFTRFYACRMRSAAEVSGSENLLAWQTGYPFGVNLARGYPRFNPGEFTADDLLKHGEVDACLIVDTDGVAQLSPAAQAALAGIPTIVLDPSATESSLAPAVHFTTAVYGIHGSGTAYRMDDVTIPLRPVLPTNLPSDADVLEWILGAMRPPS